MTILQDLNSEQTEAVTHRQGPLLIIAGAGTGKTTVITRRIAWLIAEKLAKPGEILALTFTDKAADEMESRVDQLVPYGYIDVSIATFHAFGDRVLRDHCLDLGISPDYKVLTLPEQLVFLRQHIFDLPLHYYKSLGDPTRHLEALLRAISRAQDEDISPEEYLKAVKARKGPQLEVAKVYKKYQGLKLEKGFVDFADQVSLPLKLFRKHPAILNKFQDRYKFILVDEFQDTNYAQFELLKLLAGKKANLTVVGDDDQSIYKFRGAAISNILSFEKVYRKCRKVVLNQNYRSAQAILDAAYRLIQHNNPERLEVKAGVDKKLVSAWKPAPMLHRGGFQRVAHKHFDRVGSEADWVAQVIAERKYPLSDYAILTRSNADAEEFIRSLNLAGIPFKFSGGGGLYLNPEIQIAASFLKVIGDPADSGSLYHLAISEIYNLDPLELQKLNTFAQRRNFTLHAVFSRLNSGDKEFEVLADISEATREKVRQIMADIQYYLDFAKDRTTGEVLYQFLKRSGYLEALTREQNSQNDSRIRNLASFFEKIKEFKLVIENDRVADFVRYFKLLKEAGDNPEIDHFDADADAVKILTVHKAKGLEFSVVFMVGLAAEKFPVRARQDPIELPLELIKEAAPAGDFHLQEERRLFYVAMTRAKDELYLTSSADYGGKREKKVSQFVLEALDLPKADIAKIKIAPLDQIELFAPAGEAVIHPPSIKEGGNIHLSYYQIEDYLTCPLKYKYVHVLNVPLLPNQAILYGSVLHKAAQAFDLARLNGKKFSRKDLIAVLQNNWTAEGFISREHEEQRLAAAVSALKLFYANQIKSKRKLKYVEESFSIPKDSIVLRGRWDRVEEEGAKVYIVDFKSSEVKKQEEADKRARESLQLSIYALVWKEKFGVLPHRVELYFFESGMVGSVAKGEADIGKTWEKIKNVAAGIRALDFHATPSRWACQYCAFNEICPASIL